MTDRLKPCPFCGGEAMALQNDEGYYYAGCKNAGCRGYVFYTFMHHPSEERAITAWNKRKPIEIERVVEQLEREVEWANTHYINKDFGQGRVSGLRTATTYVLCERSTE